MTDLSLTISLIILKYNLSIPVKRQRCVKMDNKDTIICCFKKYSLGSKVAPAGGHGAREGEVISSRLT